MPLSFIHSRNPTLPPNPLLRSALNISSKSFGNKASKPSKSFGNKASQHSKSFGNKASKHGGAGANTTTRLGAEVRPRLSQPLALGVKPLEWIYISKIWYSYHNVAQDIIKNFHNTEIVLNTTQYPPNQFENFRIRPPSQRALG